MGTLDKGDVVTPQPQTQKGRPKSSAVWDHFTIKDVGGNCARACCNKCNRSFAYTNGEKTSGTSHLIRHLEFGMCTVTRVQDKNLPSPFEIKNATNLEPPKKRQRAANGALALPFSQKLCNNEIAKMIILHDYPLDMVEHPGFIEFVQTLQPQFEMASSDVILDECIAIYLREKTSLANLLSEIPGRVSLSLNMWTSDDNLGYAVLSGHFIDNDWKLHRRLLNIVAVPYPESETAFNHAILSCLGGWGLESKLFALTLDRSFASEAAIGNLRGLLSIKNPHMLNGQFLIGSCYAHILSSLAMDSINAVNDTVQKVRNCVKYVKTSEVNEEKFMEIKLQLQIPSNKNLVIDNCTRWDSTYLMLSAASDYKQVFECLDTFDHPYRNIPSDDEWKQIETLCDYLKSFYEAAEILTSEKCPTADKFFAQVCHIQLKLFTSPVNENPFLNNLIKPLIEKYEMFWKDCSFVSAMAVVMDPRYKLNLVGQFFSELYGEQAEPFLRTVEDGVHALYLEYLAQSLPLPSFDVEDRQEEEEQQEEEEEVKTTDANQDGLFFTAYDDSFDGFDDIYISGISSNHHTKSELDHYLEECVHISNNQEDFNILDWWKVNRVLYPTLSKMAADLLSMPLTTVPHDSVFDTVSKKVDSFRGLQKPEAVEAFICAKDWLQSGLYSATLKLE